MDRTIVPIYNEKLDQHSRAPRSAVPYMNGWNEYERAATVTPQDAAPKPKRRRKQRRKPADEHQYTEVRHGDGLTSLYAHLPTDSDAASVEAPAEPVDPSDAPGNNQRVTSEES